MQSEDLHPVVAREVLDETSRRPLGAPIDNGSRLHREAPERSEPARDLREGLHPKHGVGTAHVVVGHREDSDGRRRRRGRRQTREDPQIASDLETQRGLGEARTARQQRGESSAHFNGAVAYYGDIEPRALTSFAPGSFNERQRPSRAAAEQTCRE